MEVGFARQQATDLFEGFPASDFQLKYGEEATGAEADQQFEAFLSEQVLSKRFKMAVKRKTELFQGELVERFYATEIQLSFC